MLSAPCSTNKRIRTSHYAVCHTGAPYLKITLRFEKHQASIRIAQQSWLFKQVKLSSFLPQDVAGTSETVTTNKSSQWGKRQTTGNWDRFYMTPSRPFHCHSKIMPFDIDETVFSISIRTISGWRLRLFNLTSWTRAVLFGQLFAGGLLFAKCLHSGSIDWHSYCLGCWVSRN